MDDDYEKDPYEERWSYLPDTVLLYIFNYLTPPELLNAGLTCKNWCRIAYDEMLWKRLFCRHFRISLSSSIAPGKKSWYSEFKRLKYHTPKHCSEVLCDHRNEVLHVSFSHDGTMFATSSKDGFIFVWKSTYPARIKHSHDMKRYNWKYTQFSQFNKSDTLLLVSGVHFGIPNSTSGEIAVFSVGDRFNLLCRVGNRPYDIFGTWFSDVHLLSGDLSWIAHMISTTGLWINRAYQDNPTEHTPVMNQLFRFYNTNASSVRVLMVADSGSSNQELIVTPQHQFPEKKEDNSKTLERKNKEDGCSPEDGDDEDLSGLPEKLLIFTTGSKTYTPHQIGFKRIKDVKFPKGTQRMSREELGRSHQVPSRNFDLVEEGFENSYNSVVNKYDLLDHVLDLHGHIIGMCLSPDHRFLYVNSRPWPSGYTIKNPLDPPPIAQEIDIHVIDLTNFKEVGPVLRSHKAYTPNNECFFIFLDVSQEYVASGAEDKHGYIWDRYYGMCIATLPHTDVVNSVAFNPLNPEMLVTTSDDFTIKIWRSKHFMDRIKKKQSFKRHKNMS